MISEKDVNMNLFDTVLFEGAYIEFFWRTKYQNKMTIYDDGVVYCDLFCKSEQFDEIIRVRALLMEDVQCNTSH